MSVDTERRLLVAGLLAAATVAKAVDGGADRRTKRQDLIGAWRLLRIEVEGPRGLEADPFYGAGSEGVLIYDAAGWFSVQIMGDHRPSLGVPNTRPQHDAAHQGQMAQALDSYYAYYGTWSFDAAASSVTHHAKGALYPAERDATYTQQVQVHGATMTFSRTQGSGEQATVQRKVWERAPATA